MMSLTVSWTYTTYGSAPWTSNRWATCTTSAKNPYNVYDDLMEANYVTKSLKKSYNVFNGLKYLPHNMFDDLNYPHNVFGGLKDSHTVYEYLM